jgi:hypothetical protein
MCVTNVRVFFLFFPLFHLPTSALSLSAHAWSSTVARTEATI